MSERLVPTMVPGVLDSENEGRANGTEYCMNELPVIAPPNTGLRPCRL